LHGAQKEKKKKRGAGQKAAETETQAQVRVMQQNVATLAHYTVVYSTNQLLNLWVQELQTLSSELCTRCHRRLYVIGKCLSERERRRSSRKFPKL